MFLSSALPARLPWLLTLTLAAAIPVAAATTFNTDDIQAHGDWHSLTLSLGEERHLRAMNGSSYSDAILSINATPGACDLPWLELRVELDDYQAESRTVNLVSLDLRVDHETIHGGRVEFVTHRGDSGFYAHLYPEEQTMLFEEMRDGETLRLRMMRSEEDPWFMAFGLDGADDAMARMHRQCESLSP